MFIRILGIVVLLCVLVLSVNGCGMAQLPKTASRLIELRQPHVDGSATHVVTRNGAVSVEGDPDCREVEILVRLRCDGATIDEAEARLAESRVEIERLADGTLKMWPVFARGERPGDAASFTVRVPALAAVKVRTSNGSITVTRADGEVDVQTSNGSVIIEDQAGPVVAETSNGSMSLVQRMDGGDGFSLKSSNGTVRVTAGQAFAGRVTLRTANGPVTVRDHAGRISSRDLKPGRGHGTVIIGEGGTESSIWTSNGAIELGFRENASAVDMDR